MPPFPLFSVLLCVGEKYDRQEECIFAISFALRELLKLPQVVHFPPGPITSFYPLKKKIRETRKDIPAQKNVKKVTALFSSSGFWLMPAKEKS